VVGNKALGFNWYGYYGEWMRHDWVIADVPYPEFYETDPDGKGWRSHTRQPMVILYDPADLACVAAGTINAYEPQPYAALRLDKSLFFGAQHEIFSAAFDADNRLLYVCEFVRELEGRLLLHTWRVNYIPTSVTAETHIPGAYRLHQNYPNPCNPSTTIRFELPRTAKVQLTVVNMLGAVVAQLLDEKKQPGVHSLSFEVRDLSSGVYLFVLRAESVTRVSKFVVLK
jgi:hypothetical protein